MVAARRRRELDAPLPVRVATPSILGANESPTIMMRKPAPPVGSGLNASTATWRRTCRTARATAKERSPGRPTTNAHSTSGESHHRTTNTIHVYEPPNRRKDRVVVKIASCFIGAGVVHATTSTALPLTDATSPTVERIGGKNDVTIPQTGSTITRRSSQYT